MGVLDKATTYLTFLANALGRAGLSSESKADVVGFLTPGAHILMAISTGAVFFGAGTYIGNGEIRVAVSRRPPCSRHDLFF